MPEVEIVTVQTPSPRQLKAIRNYVNLSRDEFAEKANVSKSAIMDYENGTRTSGQLTLQAIGICVRDLKIKFSGNDLVLPE